MDTPDYSYTSLYYSTPCLVRYFDIKTKSYQEGICIHDQLITYDGRIFPTDEIIRWAAQYAFWDNAVIEQTWIDLNDLLRTKRGTL